jgi:hypothetical protein
VSPFKWKLYLLKLRFAKIRIGWVLGSGKLSFKGWQINWQIGRLYLGAMVNGGGE